MTQQMTEETFAKLSMFLKEDANAVKLCIDLIYLGHIVDDFIDKDVQRTDDEVKQAFLLALGEIPLNPFYQAFQSQLAPMMMSSTLLWLNSNELEHGNKDERLTAFCLRNALLNLVHFCMFLLGGASWTIKHGPDFWKTFLLTNDKLVELQEESQEDIHSL
jgi:hypothetical protein